jgi:uncharacterized membrane-anchored protein YitT (DUF2179 family)
MSLKKKIEDFVIITVATVIVSAAVYFFMVPGHVTVGSASALALVLSNFIPLPISVIMFFINVILLALGYFLVDIINRKFNFNEALKAKNEAAGIMVFGIFIGVAFIVSGVIQ